MEYKIQNNVLEAVVSSHAAEIISLKRKDDGLERIWCRDPEFWANCNPILFPYTGRLPDNRYTYEGKVYELGSHGFARNAEFEMVHAGDAEITLVLKDNDDLLKVYPFHFELTVQYRLSDDKVLLKYTVHNTDDKEIYFDIGFHPAFNCPLKQESSFDACSLIFEKEEDLSHPKWNESERTSEISLNGRLDHGPVFFDDHRLVSNWIQLQDGIHAVRVGVEGFSSVGFWRKNAQAPFICIEPWYPDTKLEKKPFFRGDELFNVLPADEIYECAYYIQLF